MLVNHHAVSPPQCADPVFMCLNIDFSHRYVALASPLFTETGQYVHGLFWILVKNETNLHITKSSLYFSPLFSFLGFLFFFLNDKLIFIWAWVVISLFLVQLVIHKILSTCVIFSTWIHVVICKIIVYLQLHIFGTVSSLRHMSKDLVAVHFVSSMKAVKVCTARCCVFYFIIGNRLPATICVYLICLKKCVGQIFTF